MSDSGSFDSRRAGRQAVAWLLLLLLTAAGPAAARTSQGGASGQASGSSGDTPQGGTPSQGGASGSDTPRDQAGAPVSPAPPPPPPPPPPGGPAAATTAPGTAAAPGTTATPAMPSGSPTPPAAAGPAGAVGGLAPSDRISVEVMQMNPDVGELHLDIANNVLSLTLDQAVEIALRRNLALILQRYLRNDARLGVPQALGIYDLNLTGLAGASESKSPAVSQTISSKSSTQEVKAGLAQLFPSGGNLTFTWDNAQQRRGLRAELDLQFHSAAAQGLRQHGDGPGNPARPQHQLRQPRHVRVAVDHRLGAGDHRLLVPGQCP